MKKELNLNNTKKELKELNFNNMKKEINRPDAALKTVGAPTTEEKVMTVLFSKAAHYFDPGEPLVIEPIFNNDGKFIGSLGYIVWVMGDELNVDPIIFDMDVDCDLAKMWSDFVSTKFLEMVCNYNGCLYYISADSRDKMLDFVYEKYSEMLQPTVENILRILGLSRKSNNKHHLDSGGDIAVIRKVKNQIFSNAVSQWFSEQYDKLRQSFRQPIQPKKNRGMKL